MLKLSIVTQQLTSGIRCSITKIIPFIYSWEIKTTDVKSLWNHSRSSRFFKPFKKTNTKTHKFSENCHARQYVMLLSKVGVGDEDRGLSQYLETGCSAWLLNNQEIELECIFVGLSDCNTAFICKAFLVAYSLIFAIRMTDKYFAWTSWDFRFDDFICRFQ